MRYSVPGDMVGRQEWLQGAAKFEKELVAGSIALMFVMRHEALSLEAKHHHRISLLASLFPHLPVPFHGISIPILTPITTEK